MFRHSLISRVGRLGGLSIAASSVHLASSSKKTNSSSSTNKSTSAGRGGNRVSTSAKTSFWSEEKLAATDDDGGGRTSSSSSSTPNANSGSGAGTSTSSITSSTSSDQDSATAAAASAATVSTPTQLSQSDTFFIPTPTGPGAAAAAFAAAASPLSTANSKFANVGKLILLRNGEHEANVDRSVYCTVPDWKIELTEKGRAQAERAGIEIARRTKGDPVFVYFSPYLRSYQTMQAMLAAGRHECALTLQQRASRGSTPDTEHQPNRKECGGSDGESGGSSTIDLSKYHEHSFPLSSSSGQQQQQPPAFGCSSATSDPDVPNPFNIIGVREDSRLRDGDIGRYEGGVEELNKCLDERHEYGSFFYRFPHGESGADVCDRVSSFLDAFQREQMHFPLKTNVILVTHGLTIRMFVKRWFHLNVNTFHEMTSPPPGTPIELEYKYDEMGNYKFKLTDESAQALSLPKSLTESNGYAFRHKQLYGSLSVGAPYV